MGAAVHGMEGSSNASARSKNVGYFAAQQLTLAQCPHVLVRREFLNDQSSRSRSGLAVTVGIFLEERPVKFRELGPRDRREKLRQSRGPLGNDTSST